MSSSSKIELIVCGLALFYQSAIGGFGDERRTVANAACSAEPSPRSGARMPHAAARGQLGGDTRTISHPNPPAS
jgi:hypothetical protein